jgi:hypothetical protein
MKRLLIAVTMLIVSGFVFTYPAQAGMIEKRSLNQKIRIRQGIRSGEITRPEAKLLMHDQYRIGIAKKLAWFDGRLNPAERQRILNMQNRANHRIYRFKHNDVRRPYRYGHRF